MHIIGPIAQLAEHSTENASVRSSTLRWATIGKSTRSPSEFFLGVSNLCRPVATSIFTNTDYDTDFGTDCDTEVILFYKVRT